jgi:hypothetical protein
VLHPDLIRLADSVRIVGDDHVEVGGETYAIAEDKALQPDPRESLAALLYRRLYLRWTADAPRVHDVLAARGLQTFLTRANAGHGRWEAGWQVVQGGHGSWFVRSPQGLLFCADEDAVRVDSDSEDASCRVRVPSEYRRLLPGFYLFAGDTDVREPESSEVTTRVYWHLTPAAAPMFVAILSSTLNAASVPFRAKVLDDPRAFRRADAGVVYLAKKDFPAACQPLLRCQRALRHLMRDAVPLLTKWIAAGLALAEDPGDGQSFGQHRCALLAAALWDAHQGGQRATVDRRRAIESAFRDAGLDPEAPHLSGGSSDDFYGMAWTDSTAAAVITDAVGPKPSRSAVAGVRPDAVLLDAAAVIGESLCASAVWSRDSRACTWVGRSNPITTYDGVPFQPQVASLGPDLYGGLSGVACFLAELFTRTGNLQFRRTAVGAVRCAVQQTVIAGPRQDHGGLFVGPTGVAFAARTVSAHTDEDLVEGLSAILLRELAAAEYTSDDLLGGRAGAALACLALAGAGWESALSAAGSLAEQLCRSDLGSGVAIGRARRAEADVPLTGLAHGAAGIAVALLSTYAATGRRSFLEASRRAFAYEDALLDVVAGNWPDLRSSRDPGGSDTRRFMVAWCHGAAGIALCRIRASELDVERRQHHLNQARIALDTTLRQLEDRSPLETADTTLCHGLSGMMEALWVGQQALGNGRYGDAAVAAAEELATHVLKGKATMSGTICGGPNPSLMLGTAGLGYELLRVGNPITTPSLLLPHLPQS